MDRRAVIHIAVTLVLIIGTALVLNGMRLGAETTWDALALAFVISLLSLQTWVRRRYYPPMPRGGLPARKGPHGTLGDAMPHA